MSANAEECARYAAVRQTLVRTGREAAEEVARILGLEGDSTPRCHGCGVALGPKRGRGGLPRKWCSEKCRQRLGVRTQAASFLIGDPCAYCGGPGGDLDHILPASRGGGPEWENLTGACRTCNPQKGSMSLLQYLLARSLYEQVGSLKAELAMLREAA